MADIATLLSCVVRSADVRRAILLLICALALGVQPAAATSVYKCTDARGQTSYQDAPCARTQRQQQISLQDQAPAAAVSAKASAPPASMAPPATSARLPRMPPAPPPTMYGCVRATDGKPYLSSNGNPPSYLVPLAMLDMLPSSLSQTYGAANLASKPRPTAGMVGGNFTQVQDQCRELTRQETCDALRDAYDENAHKLQHAFKSDQPPLEQRDAELRAQLGGC
jgi:hypothetical protein